MYPSFFNILANSNFNVDPGISTLLNFALAALRTRVNMSAIGSLIAIILSCGSAFGCRILVTSCYVLVANPCCGVMKLSTVYMLIGIE
jgi:hypothetical protein